MLQTIEAVIDEQGNVRLLEPVDLAAPRRALVTVLEEPFQASETALQNEPALAENLQRSEEILLSGQGMADILEQLAQRRLFSDITTPVEWQRELRQDRQLPGRET